MISSDHFHQMRPEGHKIWIHLPPKDCKLILEQDLPSTSTPTDSFGHAHGQGSGHGCGAFSQQRDKPHNKLCVNFHNHEPNDMASTAVMETSLSTYPDDSNCRYTILTPILIPFLPVLLTITQRRIRRSTITGNLPNCPLFLQLMSDACLLITRISMSMESSTM